MKILHRTTDCGISGTTAGSDALNRDFDYDPLYRVTSATGRESDTQNHNDYLYADAPNPGTPNSNNVRVYTRKYSFDKLGNVQQVKQLGTNGFTRNFVYHTGKNTLQKIETAAPTLLEDFTYDTCGNQLTAGTTGNYVWNAANQLITYKNQSGSNDPTIFAQYDYSGMNRVSKMVKTGSAGSPVYERTIYIDGVFEYHILENGTTYEKNYVHVMDDTSRIAMVRVGDQFPDDIADSVTYNLEDQIGSSSMRLNTSGGVVDKEEYYPFGDSSLRTFSKKRYRYVGKEKDLESGLYYYGARYYAAWTCRFIRVDPLAADYPFYTPYNYAGNKPVNKIDIDGMQEEGNEGNKKLNNDDNKESENISDYVVIEEDIINAASKKPEIAKESELKAQKKIDKKNGTFNRKEYKENLRISKSAWGNYDKLNEIVTKLEGVIKSIENAEEGNPLSEYRDEIIKNKINIVLSSRNVTRSHSGASMTPEVNSKGELKSFRITFKLSTLRNEFTSETISEMFGGSLYIKSSLTEIFAHEFGHVIYALDNKEQWFKEDGSVSRSNYNEIIVSEKFSENENFAKAYEKRQIKFERY